MNLKSQSLTLEATRPTLGVALDGDVLFHFEKVIPLRDRVRQLRQLGRQHGLSEAINTTAKSLYGRSLEELTEVEYDCVEDAILPFMVHIISLKSDRTLQ